jgi:hypothetical protein
MRRLDGSRALTRYGQRNAFRYEGRRLTFVAISCASLGLWRVGIQDRFLSHWQVSPAPRWACNLQTGGWAAMQGLRACARHRSWAVEPLNRHGEAEFVEAPSS